MPLTFEWDANKARTNLAKHGIGFEEASTVFGDNLSLTILDPLHSEVELRIVVNCWLWFTPSEARIFASSVRDQRAGANKRVMKKRRQKYNEMLPEYDFSRGVRGKYVRRYAQGSNVVVLDPDVAKAFPNAEAVNSSLRSLAEIIRSQKSAAVK